jgi:hypothetical protein
LDPQDAQLTGGRAAGLGSVNRKRAWQVFACAQPVGDQFGITPPLVVNGHRGARDAGPREASATGSTKRGSCYYPAATTVVAADVAYLRTG